jgi:polar amino acid transport system substrate-binding protein
MRIARMLAAVAFSSALVAACTGAASPSPSPAPSVALSPEPSVAPSPSPSPSPDACAKENLTTLTASKLTIGADNPAYPPYFEIPAAAAAPWELGDPTTGQGFESAVAYAVAEKMGFSKAEVTWVPVPFNNAIQPGPKDFDVYLTQVSYSAERAQAVDLSDGYFDLNQSVVALKSNPIAQVTTVAGLKDFKLGAPVGTTSYDYIVRNIQPSKDPAVYDTLDAAVSALNAKQIDGIVADLPTAFFMVAVQITDGTIVGVLPTVGEVEHFSILLTKGSPLTPCVNRAIAAIKDDGTLARTTVEWITSKGAPELR